MKHVSGLLQKLTAFAAVVVALSSCNRAEYAMLPKTSSYHGAEHRSVSVKPTPVATPAAEVVAAPEAVAVVPKAEAAPAAVAASKAVAATPAAASTGTVAPAKAEVAQGPVAPAKATRKLNVLERAMVAKVVKSADKLSSKMQLNKHSEAASANKLQGKLRQGVILMLIGLLLTLFYGIGGIGTVIGLIGSILFLIGAILVILYLLDEV